MTDITGPSMPWHDLITWMFLIANGGRIVAYLPQIMAAWYCPAGAKSVSVLTWSYFAFAHLTALLYALFVLHDSRSVWIFSGNLIVTVCLVGLLLWKRMQYRQSLLGPRRDEHTNAPKIEMTSVLQHQ
jgi:Ca2+/Na+ antiporter